MGLEGLRRVAGGARPGSLHSERGVGPNQAYAPYAAVFTAEWFIHLPLFNVLLGFPLQLLGLVLTPYLAIRYWVVGGLRLNLNVVRS